MSKFARKFTIPPEFPDVLRDFAREVLRDQPESIYEYAAKYFDCKANGLPGDAECNAARPEVMSDVDMPADEVVDMPADEVEGIIRDLFHTYDADGNQVLGPREFEALVEDLGQKLGFPPDEKLRFLAEADMNADGVVEYEEFIPLAKQIVQGLFAKDRLQQRQLEAYEDADFLVHGMSREELNAAVAHIFEKADHDGSGSLSRQEFVSALQSMELGLTKKEINAIMFRVDADQDANISYGEFLPVAFDLLLKLTSMHLLELEMEGDEVVEFLMDISKAKDADMTGQLHVEDVHEMLHQANLGLTRMQLYVVLSEAEVSDEGMITYARFAPGAATLIRSMLSFESSIVNASVEVTAEEEDMYYGKLEDAFQDQGILPVDEFVEILQDADAVSASELKAAMNMLVSYGDEIPVEEAIGQIWILVKTLRRSKHT